MLPVLQAAKIRAWTAQCINNQGQLTKAWLMYAADNNEYCAGDDYPTEENWPTNPHKNWISGWEDPVGSVPNGPTGNDSDSTNVELLVNPQYSQLADYTRHQPAIFQCPANIVVCKAYPATKLCRTVSMNCWVGYNRTNSSGIPGYKVFLKTTDMTTGLGPADCFVFIEERGESIDDGYFAIEPPNAGANSLIVENMPSSNHKRSGVLGFADGHVDTHRFQHLNKFTTSYDGGGANFDTPQNPRPASKWIDPIGSIGGVANIGDLGWLEQHATCRQ
jgi:hypothetical protein